MDGRSEDEGSNREYSANVREKAKERQVAIYSMNDNDTYGQVFYQMSFHKAVENRC